MYDRAKTVPSLDDRQDPENSGSHRRGKYVPSVAFTRAKAIFLEVAKLELRDVSHRYRFVLARRIIVARQLTHSQLFRLASLGISNADFSGVMSPSDPPLPDNKPMSKSYGCTIGQWRDGAWLTARAAVSLLSDRFYPTTRRDFWDFTQMLVSIGGQPGGYNARDYSRLHARLGRSLVMVLGGLDPGYGINTTLVKKAGTAAMEAPPAQPKARRSKPRAPRSLLVAAFAKTRSTSSSRPTR